MKLSEKGIKRFNHLYWEEDEQLHEIEFEPDDFEGMVCLSVEEACEILDYLGYLHLSGGRDSFLKGLEKCNQNLYERIEQTEMSMQSTSEV